MTDRLLPNLLDKIEQRELALLGWGITTGSFSEHEILDILISLQPGTDPDDLLDQLIEHGMLVQLEGGDERFRTRMAETVRLAVNLRQWFHGQDWRTAKPLVSDVRFLSRARSVPRRGESPDDVVASLQNAAGVAWTQALEHAVRSVLGSRSVSGFQCRSAARILDRAGAGQPLGTCVAAGTGAGKTLAFYLPALSHLLATPPRGTTPRIVALYPRTELLRDQLRGLLLTLRNLGEVAANLRVGVLYGATPNNRRDAATNAKRRWRQVDDGLECPILTCLVDGCDGPYVWPDSARELEQLVCSTCGDSLLALSFTRDGMHRTSPSTLFTSTEMVNRVLGTDRGRRLLVGDQGGGPEFILLDEVHTYAGTHGAQVANLLRRWRSELASPAHFVGLSATLSDPAGFFAQLTGLPTATVIAVEPYVQEAVPFGREYFLALRGDPASQTALLSTTIQTSMLMRRMLDRERGIPSGGAFGSRLFVFTDKLDVINRLHSQLRDAEGWLADGVNRKPDGSLAGLRSRSGPDARARDQAGQLWAASQFLQTLDRPVRVSRTTSRDSGVEAGSDIVVATASLEVGFDDPDVGAVIQHKAPRDAAQFLQRRGRAGRDPSMRPWTTVVLSDYGRDRLAFQAYEQLFDPVVAPSQLPIHNRVILKMQAAWWLMDYLGRATGTPARAVLARPWGANTDRQTAQSKSLLAALRSLQTEPGVQRVSFHLRRALGLDEGEVHSILWDHPRALLTSVVPALIRRAEALTNLRAVSPGYTWADPLDDFVPRALFSALQTPEVELRLPPGSDSAEREVESISLSMREFAPGRVSYRFALRGKRERLWLSPPPADEPDLTVESFCTDQILLESPPGSEGLVLVQPRALSLVRPPSCVPDAAFGSWVWRTAFRHDGIPLDLDLPSGSGWSGLLRSVQGLTHRGACSTTVWRYASECQVESGSRSGPPRSHHRVTLDGGEAAIGFAMDVDALLVTIDLPTDLTLLTDGELLRAVRIDRLEYLINTSPTIVQRAPSTFLRGWLAQLFVSALINSAGDRSLDFALADTSIDQLRLTMLRIAREFLEETQLDAISVDGPSTVESPLLSDLSAVLADGGMVKDLMRLAGVLQGTPESGWLPWLQERLATTVAAAVIGAIGASCPDLDIDELRPDIELDESPDCRPIARIWISEDEPGGTGLIEAAIDRYLTDPRAFWSLASQAVGPCDAERVDRNLRLFVEEREAGTFSAEVERIRSAEELGELTDAWSSLRTALFRRGLDSDQTVLAALSTRLLRPGSDNRTEDLLRVLLRRWDELEYRLGIEVEVRTFASTIASDLEVRRRIRDVSGADLDSSAGRVGQVLSLLWSRGARSRSASLQSHNPYRTQLPTDRLLVAAIVEVPAAVSTYGTIDWRGVLDAFLHRDGRAIVRCQNDSEASNAVRELLTKPTAIGVLEFHPRVVGLERTVASVDLHVEIREVRQ